MAAAGRMSAADPVLRIADLCLQRGARPILTRAALDVAPGELVALMGPSGSGKTTLLRAVAGLETFQSGRIVVASVAMAGGAPASRATLTALRRKVGMVFQFHSLFEHMTAMQNICLAPVHAHGVRREVAAQRARGLLAAFGVGHRADALPRELSGGEAQRVAIARALAVDPPLLLLDEPTASLDAVRRAELGHLLRNLIAQGRTLLVATHDGDFAQEFATRIATMDDGAVKSGI